GAVVDIPKTLQQDAASCRSTVTTRCRSFASKVPQCRHTRLLAKAASLCGRTVEGASSPACCQPEMGTSNGVEWGWLVTRADTMSASPLSKHDQGRARLNPDH